MNWLKNILVVIALFVAAWPCTHADAHPKHAADSAAPSEMVEAHHCSCHTCHEVSVCTQHLEAQQTLFVAVSPVAWPVSNLVLFVISESKPVVHQASFSIADPLIALQTVQLLI